jgi:choline dehydrogenase-like flavoprotein
MEFDYVIVGGGSAGATLASRLSERPDVTVCLLEAGGRGDSILVRLPAGVVAMMPGYGKINNWAFNTVPQPGLNGRRGYQPRGRALGGSSAINAMLYIRGHRWDYDHWADLGCDGWNWDRSCPISNDPKTTNAAPMRFTARRDRCRSATRRARGRSVRPLVEAATRYQYRRRDDFNDGDNEGFGLYQVTQFHDPKRNGERCSAAAAYLHPVMAARPNLTVLTKAHAKRILFDGKRAAGVSFMTGKQDRQVKARREVILCGGAFGSPQLLQLSGVGRPEDIRRHGIAMVHEPGVGQNLQDHLDFILGWKSKTPIISASA